jgi:uncharacterized protein with PIN domain
LIVYLDTSAFVPMLVEEPASEACLEIWGLADSIVSTRLLYVEASAALARTDPGIGSLDRLDRLWAQVRVIELEAELMSAAATAAFRFGLRGYDAVHFAAGASIAGGSAVLASGDAEILEAWGELEFSTFDPNRN